MSTSRDPGCEPSTAVVDTADAWRAACSDLAVRLEALYASAAETDLPSRPEAVVELLFRWLSEAHLQAAARRRGGSWGAD